MMTKQDFIALADALRKFNDTADPQGITQSRPFTDSQLCALADFCRAQNPRFARAIWLGYIAGRCRADGGPVHKLKPLIPTPPVIKPKTALTFHGERVTI